MRKLVPSLRYSSIWPAVSMLSLLLVVWIGSPGRAVEDADPDSALPQAKQLMQDGNFADASELFRSVIKNTAAGDTQVVESLEALQQCRQKLKLEGSLDSDLASALTAHPDSYRVLAIAAKQMLYARHWPIQNRFNYLAKWPT